MYNSGDSNQSRRAVYAIVAIVAVVILAIVTISVVAINLSSRSPVNIVNNQSSTQDETTQDQTNEMLSDEDLASVKKELSALLKSTKGVDGNFDVAVRWDSLKTSAGRYPATKFLVDVDAYQQTYEVTLSNSVVTIACPQLGETKYPESFCIGNMGNYDDSISVVFGSNLPYEGYTSEDEYFSVSRNEDMKNFTDRYLDVMVINCMGDEAAKDRADAALNEWITSLGASPELFSRQITLVGCHGE